MDQENFAYGYIRDAVHSKAEDFHLDSLIKGGAIIDGLGTPQYSTNLGIEGDTIAYVGKEEPGASEVIDARNLVVSPGFIDIHTHVDTWLLRDPAQEERLSQGVTAVVVGNCGFSAAPILPGRESFVRDAIPIFVEVAWNWRSVDEYLKRLSERELAINGGMLVGHSTVRLNVMGVEKREPTKKELDQIKGLVEKAMTDGAFGLSSGLIYVPGIYSKTNELIELCKVVAKNGGIYTSHIRGEAGTLMRAVQEAMQIGRVAKVPVEVSHHKAVGRDNWGRVKDTLRMIDEAKEAGVEVNCDVYPYAAGNTGLGTLIPTWVFTDGPLKAKERITGPLRSQIIREMLTKATDEERPLVETGAENIVISYCKESPSLEGKTLTEIAKMHNSTPAETVLDLVLEHGCVMHSVLIILFEMSEDDVRTVIRHPLSMIASDSVNPMGKPHPRVYGTYTRVLAKYVREEKVLTLEEAVRKMTSMPARKLGLKDRGVINVGNKADLVIFDPDTVRDKATFPDPTQISEGIEYVFVNGKKAWEKMKTTGARAGVVLRHSLW